MKGENGTVNKPGVQTMVKIPKVLAFQLRISLNDCCKESRGVNYT